MDAEPFARTVVSPEMLGRLELPKSSFAIRKRYISFSSLQKKEEEEEEEEK